jgi:hypothetical protein
MSTGVQPVPMGTFRAETSTPRSSLIRPAVTESTSFEFWTFLQHWGGEVVPEPPPGEPFGRAVTIAARAREEMMNLENIMYESAGAGAGGTGC